LKCFQFHDWAGYVLAADVAKWLSGKLDSLQCCTNCSDEFCSAHSIWQIK